MNPDPGWAFINNDCVSFREARIHISDLALQRGYGVFDFFRVRDLTPIWLDEHLERFFFSANEMHLPCRFTGDDLKKNIYHLIQKNNLPDCGIRLTLTGGYSKDGYHIESSNLIISAHHFRRPSTETIEKGIRLMTFSHQRQFPQVKTIDYLMAVWLQPQLRATGADDVLYHHQGFISECPRANFFLVRKNGQILTAKDQVLKGITRMKLLQMARQHLDITESHITIDDVHEATEAFITSTTKGILPVSRIDDHQFSSENPIIRQLQQIFENGKQS